MYRSRRTFNSTMSTNERLTEHRLDTSPRSSHIACFVAHCYRTVVHRCSTVREYHFHLILVNTFRNAECRIINIFVRGIISSRGKLDDRHEQSVEASLALNNIPGHRCFIFAEPAQCNGTPITARVETAFLNCPRKNRE